jgi:hypothetical protein
MTNLKGASVSKWLRSSTSNHLPLTAVGSNPPWQGFWILSCEEAIQLAFGTTMVLLRCLFVPEIMHERAPQGLPPPVKLESRQMTEAVLVWRKTQSNKQTPTILRVSEFVSTISIKGKSMTQADQISTQKIQTLWPSYAKDQNNLSNFDTSPPKDYSHDIWLIASHWLQRCNL